jgi:hypothetical protein
MTEDVLFSYPPPATRDFPASATASPRAPCSPLLSELYRLLAAATCLRPANAGLRLAFRPSAGTLQQVSKVEAASPDSALVCVAELKADQAALGAAPTDSNKTLTGSCAASG